MSRIGKQPVEIPKGVDVKVAGKLITVKGPKGELKWEHPDMVSVGVDSGRVMVKRDDDTKPSRERHGLARSIIKNMVGGVSQGYVIELEIQGVGYKAQSGPNKLVFSLGYSHPVEYPLPAGIKAEVDKKQVAITLSGIDKQVLGQVAADIKALRKTDAYKGKGIRNKGTVIKLKAGKASKK